MLDKTICVIGPGYIGLPTASLLGTKSFQVHGVDVSEHVVNIKKGKKQDLNLSSDSFFLSLLFYCVKSRFDPCFLRLKKIGLTRPSIQLGKIAVSAICGSETLHVHKDGNDREELIRSSINNKMRK